MSQICPITRRFNQRTRAKQLRRDRMSIWMAPSTWSSVLTRCCTHPQWTRVESFWRDWLFSRWIRQGADICICNCRPFMISISTFDVCNTMPKARDAWSRGRIYGRQWSRLLFISFIRLLIRMENVCICFCCVQLQFLQLDFYFPHRSIPVSTGCGG